MNKKFFCLSWSLLFFIILLPASSYLYGAARIKTVEYNFGVGSSTGVLSGVVHQFPYIRFRLYDAVTIKSAWLELDGLSESASNTDIMGIDIYFNQANTASTIRDNFPNATTIVNGECDESLRFHVKCEIPVSVFTSVTAYNNYAAAANLTSASGRKFNMLALKLYITYEYNDTSDIQINTVHFPLKSDWANSVASFQGSTYGDFTYNAEIAESSAANFLVQQQWIELRGHRLAGTVTTDGTIKARIGTNSYAPLMTLDGSLIDSYDFLYLSSTGTMTGFAVNTQQTLNIAVTQDTIYNLGGECVVTYEFSKNASTKTKTVYYLLGQAFTPNVKAQFPDVNVYLEELGISFKAFYSRIHGSFKGTTAKNVTWEYSINNTTSTISYSHNTQSSQIAAHPFFLDFWPSNPNTNWTNGCPVRAVYTPEDTTNTGVMGAELIITYQYTTADKFTDSYKTMAYQEGYGTITSTSIAFPIYTSTVETPEGRKKRDSGYIAGAFIAHKAANTITTPYNITQNINSASAQAHTPMTTTESCFTTALYTDPLKLLTTSNLTLTANASINTNQLFASGISNITYSYYPPPDAPSSLDQTKSDGTTPIVTENWTNESTVVLHCNMSSRISDSIAPVFEVKPIAQAFDGTTNLYTGSYINYTAGTGVTAGSATITGLSSTVSYHWQAKVISSENGSSSWVSYGGNAESAADFSVDLSSPASPVLSSPVNASSTNIQTVNFSWSSVTDTGGSGTKDYDLEISTSSGFGNIVYSSKTANVSVANVSLNQNLYYWHVRTNDNAGNTGTWAAAWTVIVDTTAPAEVTTLNTPADTTISNQQAVTFSWASVNDSPSGLKNYILQLSTNSNFSIINYSSTTALTSAGLAVNQATYYWRVNTQDNALNYTTSTVKYSILIDTTTPPQVSILSTPINNFTTNQISVSFNWTGVSDPISGLKDYTLQLSTAADFSIINYSSTTIGTSALLTINQSSYTWRVNTRDNALNYSSSTYKYSLVIDTTVPNVTRNSTPDSIQSPPRFRAAATVTADVDFYETGSAGTSLLNVLKYKITSSPDGNGTEFISWTDIGPAAPVNQSSYTTNWTITFTSLQEWATNYVHLQYSDNAGNSAYWYNCFDVLKDTTAPSVPSLVSPEAGYITNSQTVSFDWTDAADLRSGTSFYILYVATATDFTTISYSSQTVNSQAEINNIAQKFYYWKVQAVDKAGNYSAYSSINSFLIDITSPSITIGSGLIGGDVTWRPVNNVLYDIDFIDTGGSLLSKFELSASTVTKGNYPLIGWTDSSINILSSSTYSANWQLTDTIWQVLKTNTTNYISIKTYDLAGNTSTYFDAFFIKKSSSNIRIVNNETVGEDSLWRSTSTERWYDVDFFSDGIDLQAIEYCAASDKNISGLIFDWKSIPGVTTGATYYIAPWQISSADFASLPDGATSYISVRCFDGVTTITSKDVFFIMKDTTPPVQPSLSAPLDAGATNQMTVNIEWLAANDLSSGATQYYVQVATSTNFSPLVFSSYTANLNVLTSQINQATYYWKVKAKDLANNWSEDSTVWSIQIDTTLPSVPDFSLPLNNFTTNYATQNFQWAAASDSGPAGLYGYMLLISTQNTMVPVYYSSSTKNTSCAAVLGLSSTYYWNIQSIDRAGNYSSVTSTWAVIVDTIAPQIPQFNQPLNNFTTNTMSITMSWTAADNGPAGIQNYDLQVSSNINFVPLYYSSTTVLTSITTSFAEGTYWLKARTQDTCGNYSVYSTTLAFKVDISSPSAPGSLTSPSNDFRTNNAQISFSWAAATDSGPAGIDSYELVVSEYQNFDIINYSSSTNNTSASITFQNENIYFWKVRSKDNVSYYSNYSSTYTITLDAAQPEINNKIIGGDTNWRADGTTAYDVDFYDPNGTFCSGLAGASYRIYSATTPAGATAGTQLADYTPIFSKPPAERASFYTNDWSISAAAWSSLNQGYNFVFLKSSDTAGNTYEPSAYAFFILKDTAAPEIINYELNPVWENSSRTRNVDFSDNGIGVKIASYTASTLPNSPGTWTTIIDSAAPVHLYEDNWQLNFGLLAPGTNYISIRVQDGLGNIVSQNDVFKIFKDTIAPQGITNLFVSTGTQAGSIYLQWTSPSDDTITDPTNNIMKDYFIKYKTSYFSNTNDFLASGTTWYSGLTPKSPGGLETCTITGLTEGTTYYIGAAGIDKAENPGILLTGSTNYCYATRIPPSQITDLITYFNETFDPGSVGLKWTAVGDNGLTGTAQGYSLKYATYSFNESQWDTVSTYSQGWNPLEPGNLEDKILAGLTAGVTYYFAVKAYDFANGPNYSVMSSTVSGVTANSTARDGLLCYGAYESGSPLAYPKYYKTAKAGSAWAGPNNAANAAATIYWSVLRTCPVVRNEKLLGTLSSNGAVYIQRWDGEANSGNGSWYSAELIDTIASGDSIYRPFDMAYEQTTGRCMIAWRSSTTGTIKYSIWSSTASSWIVNSQSLTVGGTGLVRWLRLEPQPGTNRIMLVTLDANNDIYAYCWDGSAWVNSTLLTASAYTSTYQCFDAAWETTDGKCMVFFSDIGSTYDHYYSLYTPGSGWAANATGPAITATGIYWVKLSADRKSGSNNIAMTWLDTDPHQILSVFNGSSWLNSYENTTAMDIGTTRLIDIAFEKDSGKCLAVGVKTANPARYICYSTWSVTGGWYHYSANDTYDLGNTKDLRWLQLTPDPNSNKIVLLGSNVNTAGTTSLETRTWTGYGWSGGTLLTNLGTTPSYEFFMLTLDNHDIIAPYLVNYQDGDTTWRSVNNGLYNVDLYDESGGSLLSKVQAQISDESSVVYRTWADEVTGLNAISYTDNWPLSQTTWNQLNPGKSYVSLKLFDGVGNNVIRENAFYILKDTQAPSITPHSAGGLNVWHTADPGAVIDYDFADQTGLSSLASAYYLIYPQANQAGTLITQGSIFTNSPGLSYTNNWGLNNGDWNLLPSNTCYLTIKCYDIAGNTATIVDAFSVLKDTVPPSVITSLYAIPGPYRGTIDLSWLAPGDNGNNLSNYEGAYEIKYATYAITSQSLFDGASTYTQSMVPNLPLTWETITISNLTLETTYYFAVRTRDKIAAHWTAISNSTNTLPQRGSIYINEIYTAGTGSTDWVELYNNTSNNYSLTGCSLVYNSGSIDSPGTDTTIWTGSAGNSIPLGGGFFLVDNLDIDSAANHHITLKDTLDRTADVVQWPAAASGKSFARIVDGCYDYFEVDPTPTKGYTNSISTGIIKINEIDYASPQQFIELYNTDSSTPLLTNWYVRNSNNTAFKFTRKIYPYSFNGIDFSSIDNNLHSWDYCMGTGGLIAAADFVVLENETGQVIDRVTWKSGMSNSYYNYKAVLIPFNTPALGSAAPYQSIGRQPSEGADTGSNSADFKIFSSTASYGQRNNNSSPAASNILSFPVNDNIYLSRRFKISLTLGADSAAGVNNSLWFIRTGGADDNYSPHIYRLSDIGINLSSLAVQTTYQTGITLTDIQGNYLVNGTAYKLLLHSDNAAGAANVIIRDTITYDSSIHSIQISSAMYKYYNNSSWCAPIKIDLTNNSPIGANNIEFSTISIRITDGNNIPLNTTQAKALFNGIYFVSDNLLYGTTGSYQPSIDTSTLAYISNSAISLDINGTQALKVTNPDGANNSIKPQTKQAFFAALQFTNNAAAANPNTFKIKIIPGTETTWKDSLSLVDQYAETGSEVVTSSPTIIAPKQPPAGTVFPSSVTAAGFVFSENIMLNDSGNTIFSASNDGKVYAVNSDGSMKWNFNLGSAVTSLYETTYLGTETNPYIYLGTQSGYLYKIEDKGTYAQKPAGWNDRNLLSAITSNISVSTIDKYLYLGTSNGQIYKMTSNGTDDTMWNNSPGISGSPEGTFIIDEYSAGVPNVWLGTSNGTMYFIDKNGAICASTNTASGIHGSPFLMAGFIADPAKNLQNIYFGDDSGYLRCLNSGNLSIKPANWENVNTGCPVRSSPIYDYINTTNNCIYFGDDNGKFYKVDFSSGGVYWTFQANGPIRCLPVLGDNNDIYFGSDDGCFYGLNKNTGQLLTGFPIITGGEIRTSPVYDALNSRIYFCANDGKIYCIYAVQ